MSKRGCSFSDQVAAMDAYAAKLTSMENGTASIYDVYSAASTAKNRCKDVQFAMSKINTPDVPKRQDWMLIFGFTKPKINIQFARRMSFSFGMMRG